MTTPVPPRYADVNDYSLRTGTSVPPEQEPTIQQRLDDVSAVIQLYLGDCAEYVETSYPDVLTALTVSHVYRVDSMPVGVRSESVGGTSVSYDRETVLLGLNEMETALLDALMATCTSDSPTTVAGVGQLGMTLGGQPDVADYGFDPDADVWVLSGGYRKW